MCAHVTQKGMTKEGDKARTQAERAGRARERVNSQNVEGGKREGAEDENSIGKIGKKSENGIRPSRNRECEK